MRHNGDTHNPGTNGGQRALRLREGVTNWPVAASYRISDGAIETTGALSRQVFPRPTAATCDELCSLADAGPAVVLEWVQTHGLLGLEGDRTETRERLDDIAYLLGRLRATRDLAIELFDEPEPLPERLHNLAREVRGGIDWLPGTGIRATAWQERARRVGLSEEEQKKTRRTIRADLDAYEALVYRIDVELERRANPALTRVRATRYTLRAEPALVARGWLGAAYLHLYARLEERAVGRRSGFARVTHLPGEIMCAGCRRPFTPDRRNKRYHDELCRDKAKKYRKRHAASVRPD